MFQVDRHFINPCMKFAIGCLVAACCSSTAFANQYSLTDAGFNSTSQALLPAGTFVFDRWEVEAAALTVGPLAGVTPFEGDGMLRMFQAGGVLSQVWQFVDLASLSAQINAGNVMAEGYAFFNSIQGNTPSAGLRLTSRSGANPNFFLRPTTANSTTVQVLDGNAGTWERLSVGPMLLPAGTNLLELELDYNNNSLPPNGFAFADLAYICLHVIPEPTGLGMALIGGFLLVVARRRACA